MAMSETSSIALSFLVSQENTHRHEAEYLRDARHVDKTF